MTGETSGSHSAEAALAITEAVERFRDSVSPDDQTQIESTKLKDVVEALLRIQQDLQRRRENRNLRKLYPFVQGLERYSGAIDVLSNGLSPYLPWIWAPIKLTLQITSDYLSAFDKLIDAYGRIAETLPRLNKLGDAFKDNPGLLTKLSLYYVDILEFHRRAYKFVRRKSWKFFFMTTWASFDFRFNSILARMVRNSEAIDQEAATIDMIEAKQWRDKLTMQVAVREKDRLERQRQSIIAWLSVDQILQGDDREKLLRDCLPGSCDWVMKQQKVASWIKTDSKLAVIWLHGKPGAGKSVICASLLNSLEDSGIATFFYFCKHHQNDTSSKILKTLVLKMVDSNPDLVAIAFTEFVEKYREPSLKILRTMLAGSGGKQGLLHGMPNCHIVIDGLDECDPKEQKYIVEDLLQLVSLNPGGKNCKLLLCSRDVPTISRAIQKKPKGLAVVSLSNEKDSVNHTVRAFIVSRLKELVAEKESLQIGDKVFEEIVMIMVDKADGMFLWTRLVLDTLSDVDSLRELHAAITSMPRELPQLYARIFDILCPADNDGRTAKVLRILAWLVFSKRPLKRHEILHGVGVTPETPVLDQWNAFDESVIDKCKPIIEELPDGSIALVHFTVHEYLRTDNSTRRFASVTWEEDIAFACVTVLKDSLCLLDPKLSQLGQLLQVLSGSHALLPYAVDFWLDHVLASASHSHLLPESSLGQALSSLTLRHDDMRSSLKPSVTGTGASSALAFTDVHLEALAHLSVCSLCAAILSFRANCRENSASNGQEFEHLALEQDLTLFSTLSLRFSELVSQLLSESFAFRGVPKDQLELFRRQYTQCSFRCRFAPCTGSALGFASETLRASHEQIHVKRLFCDKPNCSRGRIGFRQQKDLEAHKRTYHEEGSILVPPRVRKRFNPHAAATEPSTIPYDGGFFSLDVDNFSGLRAVEQKDVMKYKTSLMFDANRIEEALQKWRTSSPQTDGFAVLMNEKTKSYLDVNLLRTLQHDSVVSCVDISADDRLIATGSNGVARVFDIRTGEESHNCGIHLDSGDNYVRAVKFSCDGKYLVVGSEDKVLRVWNLQDSGAPRIFEGHDKEIYSLAIAPDGHTIVSCSGDNTVRVWDLRDKTESKARKIITGGDVFSEVVVTLDSLFVAASSSDESIYLWSIKTGELLHRYSAHNDNILSLAISPDGQTLISGSLDKLVKTWAIDCSKPRNNGTGVTTQPTKRMELHRGRWIISGSKDRSIIFWDAETGEPHLLVEGHKNGIIKLAVGHTSRIFATASGDKKARIWSYSA